MKILITHRMKTDYQDYVNVQLMIVNNLDDGAYEEIFVPEMDYIPLSELPNIVKKLAYDGTIRIQGIDLYNVCALFVGHQVEEDHLHGLLFNQQKQVMSAEYLRKYLEALHLTIVDTYINQHSYIITAIRENHYNAPTNS